jgi:hypothetical protein
VKHHLSGWFLSAEDFFCRKLSFLITDVKPTNQKNIRMSSSHFYRSFVFVSWLKIYFGSIVFKRIIQSKICLFQLFGFNFSFSMIFPPEVLFFVEIKNILSFKFAINREIKLQRIWWFNVANWLSQTGLYCPADSVEKLQTFLFRFSTDIVFRLFQTKQSF